MRLKLNKEFAVRHLAVALLMAALGGWFAYDGYVKYPAMDAATLYREAHGGEDAATPEQAEKFKANAVPRQKQFMALAWGFAAFLAANVFMLWRREYELEGEITDVDRRDWDKKGIIRFKVNGRKVALDAWHHEGVRELVSRLGLPDAGDGVQRTEEKS